MLNSLIFPRIFQDLGLFSGLSRLGNFNFNIPGTSRRPGNDERRRHGMDKPRPLENTPR